MERVLVERISDRLSAGWRVDLYCRHQELCRHRSILRPIPVRDTERLRSRYILGPVRSGIGKGNLLGVFP